MRVRLLPLYTEKDVILNKNGIGKNGIGKNEKRNWKRTGLETKIGKLTGLEENGIGKKTGLEKGGIAKKTGLEKTE